MEARPPDRPVVCVLGDIAVDVRLSLPALPRHGEDAFASDSGTGVGGCGANVSICLARLGITPRIFAGVGDDLWGQEALALLSALGADVSVVTVVPGRGTHLTVIVVTPDGERTMLGHRAASSHLGPDVLADGLAPAVPAGLVVSGYALADDPQRATALRALDLAARDGVPVTLDLPGRLSSAMCDITRDVLPQVGLLIVAEDDVCPLGGRRDPEAALAFLADQVADVVVTQGADGCRYLGTDGFHRASFPPVRAHDSTGAGDAFAAGLVAARLAGLGMGEALEVSSAFGAAATVRPGAGRALPGPADALALLLDGGNTVSAAASSWLSRLRH
ncbi:carbohydrate kinase family protein [Streptomyces sp. NPDC046925]|uniref:carbohydrate kinase family protein n=1 Tax=Streptomyces sp. NPDC046925 TaxID=3155375 RepID=UPI00340DCB0E